MHTIADDQDQGGPVHGPVPVGQEGFAGARMGDLCRNSGRRELENSHEDVFRLGVGGSTRAGNASRGSREDSGRLRDLAVRLGGFRSGLRLITGDTGGLHHGRAPGGHGSALRVRERGEGLGEELVAEGDDLLLAR